MHDRYATGREHGYAEATWCAVSALIWADPGSDPVREVIVALAADAVSDDAYDSGCRPVPPPRELRELLGPIYDAGPAVTKRNLAELMTGRSDA